MFTGLYRCLQVFTGRVREGFESFTGVYRSLQVVTGVTGCVRAFGTRSENDPRRSLGSFSTILVSWFVLHG